MQRSVKCKCVDGCRRLENNLSTDLWRRIWEFIGDLKITNAKGFADLARSVPMNGVAIIIRREGLICEILDLISTLQLEGIPISISSMDLTGCGVGTVRFRKGCLEMLLSPTFSSLKRLNLERNRISTTKHFLDLNNVLQVLRNIRDLNLESNSLGAKGMEILGTYLADPRCSLESLSLDSNDLGPDGGVQIGVALISNTSLRHLNLARNWIGPDGVDFILGTVLCKYNRTLRSLNLANNLIKTVPEGICLQTLCLESLNLVFNHITAESGQRIIRALTGNHCLRSLNMSFNPLGPLTAKALASLLETTQTSINELTLNRTYLSDHGVETLASSLRNNATVETLALRSMKFDDPQTVVRALKSALKGNRHLKKLDIGDNNIDCDNFPPFSAMFPNLKAIDLAFNLNQNQQKLFDIE